MLFIVPPGAVKFGHSIKNSATRNSVIVIYPQFRNPTNSFRSLRSKPPRMRFLLFKLAFCHILTDMSA